VDMVRQTKERTRKRRLTSNDFVISMSNRRCRKLNIAPVGVPGGRVSHGTPKGSGAEALAEFQGMASEVQGEVVRHGP